MSKSISFGFGKPKIPASSTPKPSIAKAILLPQVARSKNGTTTKPSKSALAHDSDEEDEAPPQLEAVTGFTSSGAILSKPQNKREERVIANSGNGDWRKRGRTNILPAEVQAAQQVQQNGGEIVTIERNEVSTASGLQFAGPSETVLSIHSNEGTQMPQEPERELTEDERALQALLDGGTGKSTSNAIIETKGNIQLNQRDETDDFRADVASRPESATLEDYAAMPVEEFGLAMLRGMGQKRRANGEVITFGGNNEDKTNNQKQKKQEGFLGIGAKPAKGLEGVELGAWGKAEMRKNNRGEGFFTPVMLEDKRTGERISEEELERRKREAKAPKIGEEDWRDRRDKNLERDGRDTIHKETNGSKKRDRDDREYESRARRDTDRNGYGYESSRSRRDREDRDYDASTKPRRDRDRSPTRENRKRDDTDTSRKDRDKYRDRYHDRDRYDSSSSKHSQPRERDRDKVRDRDRDDRRRREKDYS